MVCNVIHTFSDCGRGLERLTIDLSGFGCRGTLFSKCIIRSGSTSEARANLCARDLGHQHSQQVRVGLKLRSKGRHHL